MFEDEDNIRVPENLDDYVKKGIALGVKKKKASSIKLMTNTAVICLLILFTVSVRVSPIFAAYMVKVPGLEYLVRFINYDKGLQSAVENNFIQSINSSITKEGIKFTIKDVVIDKSQAIIFYSIENEGDSRNIQLANINITNEKSEDIKGFVSWGSSRPNEASGSNKVEDRIDIDFTDKTILPDKLHLEVKLRDTARIDFENYEESMKKSILESSWNYDIPIDKEKIKAMEKSYVLNQSVEIEGQRMTFKEVKITPTRIAVEVEYDKNNSKKILGFDDIAIINEKGETWGTIMNGVTSSRKDENHDILYFQSSYFTKPGSLYIKASSIRALDKDKLDVIVDLENSKLIKAPDERLKLKQIDKTEKEVSIMFILEKEKGIDDKVSYSIFSGAFKDADGNTYNVKSYKTWEDGLPGETKVPIINLVIDNSVKINGFIYFDIFNYPERIRGEFKVKIN